MMVDQEHQVDQDLVVVKMDMIMDLLVLVVVVLQAVILVRMVQQVQVMLVMAVVVPVVQVVMEQHQALHRKVVMVVQVSNFLPLSAIPINLLD
jgi:hypothetical protein